MEIKRYTGIRNSTSEERFRPGDLMSAVNLDLDNTGKPMSRFGFDVINAGAAFHSIYADDNVSLIADGTDLCRLDGSTGETAVIASLGSTNYVSYETLAGRVYLSNSTVNLIVDRGVARKWGIDVPTQQPQASAIAGSLRAGTYQYAMTFLRNDGQESGTGASAQVIVGSNGGIAFTDLPVSTDPTVDRKAIYISSADGDNVLYMAGIVDNSVQTMVVQNYYPGVILETQFCGPPPAGSIVRYHSGHMYVVVGNIAYFSKPHNPELFYKIDTFLRFPGDIAIFEPVDDGIFVATADSADEGDTWFLSGREPGKFVSVHKFSYGAIPGTSWRMVAGDLESPFEGEVEGQGSGTAVMWVSRHGFCAGFSGGQAKNYTEAKFGLPPATRGATLLRKDRGFVSFIATLQGVSPVDNIYSRG